jgi:YHS domain-containing protein
MKIAIATLAALIAVASVSFADSPAKTTSKTQKLICPITGAPIKSIKDAAGHSVYKGVTYYFCCPMCKPTFDKDPAKAVANMKAGKFGSM